MGRHRKATMILNNDGPHRCYFECGNALSTKFNREAPQGWEWFTGYGERPLHFCPWCRVKRQAEIDAIRAKLNVRPEGYPQVRQTP